MTGGFVIGTDEQNGASGQRAEYSQPNWARTNNETEQTITDERNRTITKRDTNTVT